MIPFECSACLFALQYLCLHAVPQTTKQKRTLKKWKINNAKNQKNRNNKLSGLFALACVDLIPPIVLYGNLNASVGGVGGANQGTLFGVYIPFVCLFTTDVSTQC